MSSEIKNNHQSAKNLEAKGGERVDIFVALLPSALSCIAIVIFDENILGQIDWLPQVPAGIVIFIGALVLVDQLRHRTKEFVSVVSNEHYRLILGASAVTLFLVVEKTIVMSAFTWVESSIPGVFFGVVGAGILILEGLLFYYSFRIAFCWKRKG